MKNFDMTRFGRVLKLDFTEGLKPMMWGTLCMLLLYLFFFWFAWNIGFHSFEPKNLIVNPVCESVAAFSGIAMYIFFLVTACTLYRGEQKKQQRIAWLMLPASNLEKFTSRWIYMLVFSIVGGLLPFFVADLIHMGYLWVTGFPVKDATSYFFKFLPHVREPYEPLSDVIGLYFCYVAIHSFFLLGGVFFKKFHFIVTSVVFVIGFITISVTANTLGYRNIPTPECIWDDIIAIVFAACLITLFTWLAYRLFCRWQVITHKFANV